MAHTQWSRRTFLAGLGSVAAVCAMPTQGAIADEHGSRVALAATASGIHTLRRNGGGWTATGFTAALLPAAMALSADADRLYVANAVNRCGLLPTGSVTTYRVSPAGALTLLGTAPLALAARQPYALAVSPCGTMLVTASDEGVLSLLAVTDGVPGAVIAAQKMFGAAVSGLAFQRDGVLRVSRQDGAEFFRVSAEAGFERCAAAEMQGSADAGQQAAVVFAGARAVVLLPA